MRPGYLYFSTFVWLVFTGGRFTAPFLHEVAGFDDTLIGVAIAIQMFLISMIGSVGAVFSDWLEFKYPNKGRVYFLAGGIGFGTLAFEIHCIVQLIFDGDQSKHPSAYILHFMARILYSLSSAIISPILDGITLSYIQCHQSSSESPQYGQERVFGAISWAIASIVIGPILDRHGFKAFFYTAPIGALLCFLCFVKYVSDSVSIMPMMEENKNFNVEAPDETVESEMVEINKCEKKEGLEISDDTGDIEIYEQEQIENDDLKGHSGRSLTLLKSMMSSYTACGFLVCGFTLSMGTSLVESLVFLFFEKLGGSNTICGLTVVVTVVFEIPIFQFASKLLDYFGAESLQMIACLSYVTRVVGYTYVPKDHVSLILLLEPLHGITYACSRTSAFEFAARITPKGYEASGQGLLSMILGLGSVVGLSLGGWIEETFGPKILYRSYAGIVGIGLMVFWGAITVDEKKKMEYQHLQRKPSEIDRDDMVIL